MNEKLFETINTLIQTGGTTAIVIFVVYIVGQILKFGIGFGCVLAGIYRFCKTLLMIFEDKKNEKNN